MKKFTYILIVIATMICLSSCSEKKMSVREYLVRLYNDTDGDNWKRNDNWLSDRPINEWYGIEYDGKNLKIDLRDNNLTGSIDLSGCTQLTELGCSRNQLTSLDVTSCTQLTGLWCWENQLTSLDVSGCTQLTYLGCFGNQLTSLDVSSCRQLTELGCWDNQLTSLDVSSCTLLEWLLCSDNHLTSLDVSSCTLLEWLLCSDNHLTSLDVSGCTQLTELHCEDNKITQEIPEWFIQLEDFKHDQRYTYHNDGTYTDKGIGWWYLGEPESGRHWPQ